MAYYVGLDVAVKETSICIMDDKGVVAARSDIALGPASRFARSADRFTDMFGHSC